MCFDPLLILMEDRAEGEIAFDPIGTMGEHVELSALRPQLDLHAGPRLVPSRDSHLLAG
jgi:hypothetical protein